MKKLKKKVVIHRKKASKREVISSYIQNRNRIYIIESGEAHLIHSDSSGSLNIVDYYGEYDIFSDMFFQKKYANEISILSNKKTTYTYFDYNEILVNFSYQDQLEIIQTLFQLVNDKISHLHMRTILLTQKSTRDKLITYFEIQASQTFSRTFTLPFSYSDFANYLSANRSSLMRILSQIEADGIITRSGRTIKLK